MSRGVIDCREFFKRLHYRARVSRRRNELTDAVRAVIASRADAGESITALAFECNRTEQMILYWLDCWRRGVGPFYQRARWLPGAPRLAIVHGGAA